MSSKQDRTAARTASDLERKYNFGESFAEAMGLAEDAKETAESAKNAADEANQAFKGLDQESVFNLLTNNGEEQGIYRENGKIYINASYLKSGIIFSEGLAYVPPNRDNVIDILRHSLFPDEFPVPEGLNYDLNGDGVVNNEDVLLALDCSVGRKDFADCPGAFKSKAGLMIDINNPEKTIRIYGNDTWGAGAEVFIGIGKSSFAKLSYLDSIIRNDYIDIGFYHETEDGEKAYFNPPMDSHTEYRTVEWWMRKPVYTMLTSSVSSFEHTIIRKGETVIRDGVSYTQVWYVKD